MMKTLIAKTIIIAAICSAAAAACPVQQFPEPPLTNASVVKLVRAGFKEKTVIAIINNRPGRFNLSPDKLIELKRANVSENIILAMLAQDESFVFSDDEWADDSTFGSRKSSAETDRQRRTGDTGIFGGRQGSRGQSSGRGMSGANEGETTTTGSATVRILRPPAEPGETSLKLEKTPSLSNDSVIKLVEAGFSEGTIIKRIEDSPADFDLSPPGLEELRRRRVSEGIIAAMTAAMSDEPNPKQTGPGRAKGN
jgi:hypothetical protein